MRSFLAGLFALWLLSSGAMAQVTGFVESVGLGGGAGGGGVIRPDRWTPMRVHLSSHVSTPEHYQLQVWQDDLDKDRVVYTKDITLSPQSQEKFDLYFVFQPSQEFRESVVPAGTLQRILQVRVCMPVAEGKKPDEAKVIIDRLPIKFSVNNIDFNRDGVGTRLVLCVTDNYDRPGLEGYQRAAGLTESVEAVTMRPVDLGENVLFYSAVDTVIWMGGNADDLSTAGSLRREALEQFVRDGGRLIVCQPAPADLHNIEAFRSILPVELKDAGGNWLIDFPKDALKKRFIDERAGPDAPPMDALPWLARNEGHSQYKSNWHQINADGKHPIYIARAQKLKPDALVAYWQTWPDAQRWPYVVRRSLGLGSVTWVAQDLGDPNLHGPDGDNWPHIWDHVIGWHNDTFLQVEAGSTEAFDLQKRIRANGGGLVDFSKWLLEGTEHPGRGAAYIFVAILFFIAYWIAAGPGTYVILSRRKRKELNWFIFGAWAFVGTAFTVGVVRMLLHGGAEAKHLTIVRQCAGEQAQIYTRVGLYIPRDGDQTLTLENTSRDAISYITPLQIHPLYEPDTNFPAAQVYAIPVHDDPQPVNIRIPYRSTLKKLQVRWVGDMKNGVDANGSTIKLIPSNGDTGVISGKLLNQTGNDMRNIYFVFRYPLGDVQVDKVLFIQKWAKGKPIDLNDQYNTKMLIGDKGESSNSGFSNPRDERNTTPIKGDMTGWSRYWTHSWSAGSLGGEDPRGVADFNPGGTGVSNGFPILSLFDLITPERNSGDEKVAATRVDFLRRGGGVLNMSQAVAAGRLVILAQSADDDAAIPFPLLVDSSRVEGQGRVLYQFSLPLDRKEMETTAKK